MKKTTKLNFIFILFLLVPIIGKSQVRFGITGSLHRSNISEIHINSDARIAGALGIFAQIPIGQDQQFYFQPEIAYSLQGEKDKDDNYFQNYVTIPLLFKAYLSEADNEFFTEIGPEVSFLVSQNEKEKEMLLYGDNPQSINYSLIAGIGYSFLRNIEISLRYNYGLVDVYKNVDGQQRTSLLSLNLSYVFD